MSTLILQQKWESFSFKQGFVSAASTIQVWLERHHQRKQLANLGVSQLVDIGLSVNQVKLEISKPFWK